LIELEGVDERDISIEPFYSVAPYTAEEKPSIYCKVAAIPKDEIKLRDENIKRRGTCIDADLQDHNICGAA
jgi:hypothetical protein